MASKNGHVSAPQIVRRAIEQVAELTGREIEGVNGLERGEDGWVVTLEVVELRRGAAPTPRAGRHPGAGGPGGGPEGAPRPPPPSPPPGGGGGARGGGGGGGAGRARRYYRSQVEEG